MVGQATLAEADHLVLTADNISGSAGSPTNAQVATFTDTYLGNSASDFAAVINWGDGNTSAGTVTGSNGSFTVTGSNTYASAGTDTFTVNVTDDDVGTASASGSGTATIVTRTLVGTMVLTSATEGTALGNTTTVATFTDSDTSDAAGDFSATIVWGDGATTAGTVVGSNGSFTVQGGHTYADEGSDPASVTLTHTADNASATASGSVAVAEGDVLTGHGITFRPKAGQSFTGTVATFSDTDTANVAGDFTASINWGDGSTTSGTVSGGSGTFTVSGTHTYAHAGHDNVTVTLTDDAPGTATATALSSANVSTLSKNDFDANNKSDLLLQNSSTNHPDVMVDLLTGNGSAIASSATITTPSGWAVEAAADFNNDGNSDIVLQNSDGTPQIWLMNGTSVTSTVTLTNPGSSWHIIAAADFNNDGTSDLLFQNQNGSTSIWEMNGTSVVSTAVIGNPGTSWHAIGAGDFNNDGNADILFQNIDNNNGTPLIWEMNGSSIIAQATLPSPGKSWTAIGTGDFNNDGNADILFQNKDGTPAIWEMNGTSVVSMTTLPNPGSKWQAIGTSDFNGDGMSDLLFQNVDGTPAVWLMNGTSVVSMTGLPDPGSQWVAKDDGPFQTDAGGSSSTPHLSSPDTASLAAQAAGAAQVVAPGTSGLSLAPDAWLQQTQQSAWTASLHLT
jgi:VCBS repeat protein